MSGIVGPRLIPTPPSFADTNSFQLDGATDFITYADNSNLSFGDSVNDSPFSISAWIKFDNTGSRQGIVSKFSATNNCEYSLFLESNNTLKVYLFDGASTKIRGKASTAITTGVWNYVTFTYDGQGGSSAYNGMKIYLNGVDISSSNVTLNTYTAMHNMSAPLKIGEYFGNYASGNLDEISIFNTELSQSEVLSIFNGGLPDSLTAFNPLLWLRMGEEATWNGSEFVLDNQGSIGGTATSVGILPTNPNPTTDVPLFDNKSFTYDGNLDYINIGDNNNLSFGDGVTDSPFSISAWINMDTDTNFSICSKYSTSGNLEYQFVFVSGGRLMFRLFDGGSTVRIGRLTADISSNVGSWTHVVATYDGSSTLSGIKIYVNNNRSDVTDSSLNTYIAMHNTSTPFLIGRYATSYADGKINDTSIFNSELTQANVTTIFNGGVPNDISSLNPLSWWRAEQVTFDGADWTLIDQGSGGNNGTSVSMPLTARTSDVPLFDNKSFTYDGIADYVDMGNVASLNFRTTDAFSLSFWFNSPSNATVPIFVGKSLTSGAGYIVWNQGGKINFRIRTDAGGGSDEVRVTASTTTPISTWTHCVITYDGSVLNTGIEIYLNGVAESLTRQGTITSGVSETIASFNISSRDNGNLPFEGNIDEASVFNSELTQANVTTIFNGGVPNDISSLNPLGYWRAEEVTWDGSNWTMIDQGSGANNGLTSSMPLTSRTSDVPT